MVKMCRNRSELDESPSAHQVSADQKKTPEEIFKQVDVLKSYLFHMRLLIKIYHCAINLHSSYMAYVNRIEFVFVNTYQKFVVTNYIAEPFHRIFLGFFSNTRNAILVNEWKNICLTKIL